MFLRNDRALGVKNGTLGTVQEAAPDRLLVRLDGDEQARPPVLVERARYDQVDHGYAVTLHKAQGATVDRAALLGSGGMDRHLAYVGMTRHREQATLYAGRDDFRDERDLAARLGRERAKGSTLDFAERRGFETERPWAENARAWVEQKRKQLRELGERVEQAMGGMRERLTSLAREAREMAQSALHGRGMDHGRSARLREMLAGKEGSAEAERERGARLQQMFGAEHGGGRPDASQDQAAQAKPEQTGKKPTVQDYWQGVAAGGAAASRAEEERKARLRQAMQEPDKPRPHQEQDRGKGRGR